MGIFGKILAAPVRLINAPLTAMERICDPYDGERIVSAPLEALAQAIEEVDEDDE